jgi:hypothetical protein
MSDDEKLYNFTQLLVEALDLVSKANQMPEYVIAKGVNLNSLSILESFKEFSDTDKEEIFKIISSKKSGAQVLNCVGYHSKSDLYNLINDHRDALQRLVDPMFSRTLQKYITIANLAQDLNEIFANLLQVEAASIKENNGH